MKLFVGADHRGFALKEKLKPWLISLGHDVTDCGNTAYDEADDYPDFSFAVADRVTAEAESRGILICGSAVGVTIAANKVKGARCSSGISVEEVKRGRQDDDLNILALSGDFIDEVRAKELISVFLTTPFTGDERHVRRLKKIEDRESSHG